MKILGIDCWDVIFNPWGGFPVSGSLESLQKINQSGKFEKIYVISKVGPISKYLTLIIFRLFNFYKRAGIPRKNIFFCRKYEQKAPIAQKLGVTHFIDDRPRVLSSMEGVKHIYIFNPRTRDLKKYPETAAAARIVKSWAELLPLLLN